MRKIFSTVTTTMLFTSLLASAVGAQSNELPDPGLLPDNGLYSIKLVVENATTVLTLDKAEKASRKLELAERRLAEAKSLAEKESTSESHDNGNKDIQNLETESEDVKKAIERYEKYLDDAINETHEIEDAEKKQDVLAKVSEVTVKHQTVLAEVYAKVPLNAKAAIQNALEKSMQGHETAINALSKEKKGDVEKRVDIQIERMNEKLKNERAEGRVLPEVPMERREEMTRNPNGRNNIPDEKVFK